MNVSEQHVQEIKALIESGDIDIAERRSVFHATEGRSTTLTDEQLIRAIAATDDDDDDLFVNNVKALEQELQTS